MTDLTEAVDQLQAVPLEDFVAERKRLAKELRAAGDRDGAGELAKLPKPTPPAWALNHFAREQPDATGAWLDVAEALRAESADPGAGLREAMAAHREATGQLVKAVRDEARPNGRRLSEPMLERVRALLQAALTDPEQAERLRAGRIAESDEGELVLPPPAAPRAPSDDAAAKRRAKERAERRAELERALGVAQERLEQAQAEAGERADAAAAASERRDEARRTLHRSESEAGAADDAAKEARAAAGEAEREAETLAAQLSKLDDS